MRFVESAFLYVLPSPRGNAWTTTSRRPSNGFGSGGRRRFGFNYSIFHCLRVEALIFQCNGGACRFFGNLGAGRARSCSFQISRFVLDLRVKFLQVSRVRRRIQRRTRLCKMFLHQLLCRGRRVHRRTPAELSRRKLPVFHWTCNSVELQAVD